MTESMDWNGLAKDWQKVEVDTSACAAVVKSVRWRSRLMLSGVIMEILVLVAVVALLVFLQRVVPVTHPLTAWALFGLLVSIASMVFKIYNSAGLWRSEAVSTRDMLTLSRRRLKAIARSAKFGRKLTLVFAIVLPVWVAIVLLVQPQLLLANGWVTPAVFGFAVVWIGAFWISTGRSLKRCEAQLKSVENLLGEFS